MALQDITGLRFGRLVVSGRAGSTPHGAAAWLCRCDCGQDCVKIGGDMRAGKTLSCGCLQREATAASNMRRIKHGHTRDHNPSPEWRSWKSMLDRCYLPSMPNYYLYGGRGITVCEQWRSKDGFSQFYEDLGKRPKGCTLDRIDSDGNYEPRNCRWSTAKEQSNNRRNTPELQAARDINLKLGRKHWPRKK